MGLPISGDTDSSEKGVDRCAVVAVKCAHLSDAVVTAGLHAALFTCGTSGPLNFIWRDNLPRAVFFPKTGTRIIV